MAKEFIKEKIVKKTEAGRGFRKAVKIVVGAILFGVIAAGVFVMATPYAQRVLGTESESTTEERVTIPRDETEAATLEAVAQAEQEGGQMANESEPEEESLEDGELINDVTVEESTAPVEEIVQEVIGHYDYTIDDFNNIWSNIAKLCDSCDPSIMTVRAKIQNKNVDDIFGDAEKENSFSGIIIAETFNESMILTDIGAVSENASSIEVEWASGATQQVYVRQVDKITGLAVVCARKADMPESVKKTAVPIKLGNTYAISRGDLLVAVGAPRKEIHSTGYTWASYIKRNDEDIDGNRRLIYTSEQFDSEHGTWMLNSAGELIGWVRDGAVVGISDYKSLLESMVNSADYAYLGVVATEIPTGTKAFAQAPQGIFIKDTVNEGPAYTAGILPGDIITEFADSEVHTIGEFKQVLENLRPGEKVTAVVYRDARGDYKEIEYEVEVGSR